MRILLVEDEKNLSAAVCRLLQKERFVVDPVYNGPDGLDNALSGNYDAIILDVMLPGMDGFTILGKVRAAQVKTPVLMLTARGDLQDRIRGLEGGADYYLPKPFQMEELIACLRAITRRGDGAPVMKNAIMDRLGDKAYFAPAQHAGLRAASACALASEYAKDEANLKDCMTLLPLYLRAPQAERERAAKLAAQKENANG